MDLCTATAPQSNGAVLLATLMYNLFVPCRAVQGELRKGEAVYECQFVCMWDRERNRKGEMGEGVCAVNLVCG